MLKKLILVTFSLEYKDPDTLSYETFEATFVLPFVKNFRYFWYVIVKLFPAKIPLRS